MKFPNKPTKMKVITFNITFPKADPLPVPKGMVQYGPIELGLQFTTQQTDGPGDPPSGFVGGTTSKTEWFFYWALTKIIGPEGEPGKNGLSWTFQESFQGGRHIPGGSVLDFVVYTPLHLIGIRVQTYRFHLGAGSEKHAYDFEQRISLHQEEMIVIDVYEQDFIWDETGRAVLHVAIDAINGVERINPITTGMIGDYG